MDAKAFDKFGIARHVGGERRKGGGQREYRQARVSPAQFFENQREHARLLLRTHGAYSLEIEQANLIHLFHDDIVRRSNFSCS